VAFDPFDRGVDGRESVRYFSGTSQGVRQFADQRDITWEGSDLGDDGTDRSQFSQSCGDVATLDQHDSAKASEPTVPKAKRVPRRVIEQHVPEALRRRQIAAEERDRARSLSERIADGQHVTDRKSGVDGAFDDGHRLIA